MSYATTLHNIVQHKKYLLLLIFLSLFRITYYWIDPYERGIDNILYPLVMAALLFGIVYEKINYPKLTYLVLGVAGVISDNVHGNPVIELWMAAELGGIEMIHRLLQDDDFIIKCTETLFILGWWVLLLLVGLLLLRKCEESSISVF